MSRNKSVQAVQQMSLFLACGVLPWLWGCATCTNGTTQEIPVTSTPSGASVMVDDIDMGETPCKLQLARKCDHVLVLTAPGYLTETRHFTRKPSGAVRGNIWLGGLIGWIVDLCTGADNNLVPDEIHAELQPVVSFAPPIERNGPRPADSDQITFGKPHRIYTSYPPIDGGPSD